MNKSPAITGISQWRIVTATLSRERLLTHNLIVAAGTVIAGALGIAFQAIVSHNFRPSDYGSVFAVVTVITFIGLPAGSLTLLMARQTSRDLASGQYGSSATLLRRGSWAMLLAGTALAGVLALTSPFIAALLNVQPQLLVAAAVGLPFGLALPLLIGEFQGEQRFVTLSALVVCQAGLKLVGAVVLGVLWGPTGIIWGISLATFVTFLIARVMLRHRFTLKQAADWWRPAATYMAIIVPSTLALGVLLSSDVLIVKHFFPTRAAGEYAAVAALSRAIYWGASGVAAVLFPKVIFSASQGNSGSRLVVVSLALVAAGGLAGLGLLSLASTWLLNSFAGPSYSAAAIYLPWYAVGMVLLGGVAVMIATHQSTGRAGFLAVLVPLTVLEPAALIGFHQNLMQVVQVTDICMALILAGLGAQYFVQEGGAATKAKPAIAHSGDVRLGVNK